MADLLFWYVDKKHALKGARSTPKQKKSYPGHTSPPLPLNISLSHAKQAQPKQHLTPHQPSWIHNIWVGLE